MHRNFKRVLSKSVLHVVVGVSLFQIGDVYAQKSTSHSPYSQFGIGQMREDLLPQTRAMGGISTGVRHLNGLPTLNMANPASYSGLSRTVLEAGFYANTTQLTKGARNNHTGDFAFSHFAIAVPFAKYGGMAFGILPFSDVGYSATTEKIMDNTKYQTSVTGEGGLNKAFIGYGVSPIKGLSIGANVGLIFGNLYDIYTAEYPFSFGAYNSQRKDTRNIKGVTLDYGAQYSRAIGDKLSMTIGYSGSLDNEIKDRTSSIETIFEPNADPDFESAPLDTITSRSSSKHINLPLKHNVGFTISKGYNWMIGADFKYADWSKFNVREGESALGKNYGFAIGGQIKPDPTSIRYWNQVDYRLGFRYNQMHYTINNNKINDMAVTVGFGFPLPETNFGRTFSQINISAEVGQQGTVKNNLVRERYININLGFTINDKWFIRRNLD